MSNLNLNVLVLNKMYMPIDVVAARDAFSMLCKGSAEVVTVDSGRYDSHNFDSWAELSELKRMCDIQSDDDWVSTVTLMLLVPRVIRVTNCSRNVSRKVNLSRRNIFFRDNHTCQYCGKSFGQDDLTLDHVIPQSKGGKSTWENLATACWKCNAKKDNMSLKECRMKLLREPFKPKFIPNFQMRIHDAKYITWRHFVSEMYWNAELISE